MKNYIKSLLPIITVTVFAGWPQDASAIDIFMNTDPRIEGDSTFPGHEGEIVVLSWGWGLSNSATIESGIVPGDVDIQAVTVIKNVDRASSELYRRILSQEPFDDVRLSFNIDCNGPKEFMQVVMEDVVVTSNSMGFGTEVSGVPPESTNLIFRKICIEITAIRPADCSTGPTSGTSYDVITQQIDNSC